MLPVSQDLQHFLQLIDLIDLHYRFENIIDHISYCSAHETKRSEV